MNPTALEGKLQRTLEDGLRLVCAPTIPGALDIISCNYLGKIAGICMADFNELSVEEQDVGWVPSNPLCLAFPLNCHCLVTWLSMLVNI